MIAACLLPSQWVAGPAFVYVGRERGVERCREVELCVCVCTCGLLLGWLKCLWCSPPQWWQEA